jgi:hypothetical protein
MGRDLEKPQESAAKSAFHIKLRHEKNMDMKKTCTAFY